MKNRSISNKLYNLLDIEGKYHAVTEIVKIDPYLDMEMRGEDGVMIYLEEVKYLLFMSRKD